MLLQNLVETRETERKKKERGQPEGRGSRAKLVTKGEEQAFTAAPHL